MAFLLLKFVANISRNIVSQKHLILDISTTGCLKSAFQVFPVETGNEKTWWQPMQVRCGMLPGEFSSTVWKKKKKKMELTSGFPRWLIYGLFEMWSVHKNDDLCFYESLQHYKKCWAALLYSAFCKIGWQLCCGIKTTEWKLSPSLTSLVSFKKPVNYLHFSSLHLKWARVFILLRVSDTSEKNYLIF